MTDATPMTRERVVVGSSMALRPWPRREWNAVLVVSEHDQAPGWFKVRASDGMEIYCHYTDLHDLPANKMDAGFR